MKRSNRFVVRFVSLPRALSLSVIILASATLHADGQARHEVDLSLVIGIDCSYSVDSQEFNLQKIGIAQALASQPVLNAIADGPLGRISVIVVQWSSAASQIEMVPWTLISGPSDATRLARLIAESPRLTSDGATSTSAFIDRGRVLLATSPFQGLRVVIDVASDGTNNNGGRVEEARDRALRAGIVINGLTIIHEIPWLFHYFQNRVTGGAGSFVMTANSYAEFGEAMRRKLEREIRGLGIS
ncbi:MAG: DUF1194 domain-containing protein [Fimbriimonadaceae bacterium]|nr:DUF1194 domain-containing protein [Alphaproteobacteria bacterium]